MRKNKTRRLGWPKAGLGKSCSGPDPITIGEELGMYLVTMRRKYLKDNPFLLDNDSIGGVIDHIELVWERDFWRAKALVTPLP